MKSGTSPSRQRTTNRWGWAKMCCLVLAGSLSATSCESIKVKAGGVEVEIVNGHAKATGNLPPGKCLKFNFEDKDGNPTGSTTTGVPSEIRVPPNTHHGSVEVVDCEQAAAMGSGWPVTPTRVGGPPSPGGSNHSAPLHASAGRSLKPHTVDIYGFPVTINNTDGGLYKNAVYHVRVTADVGVDPFSLVHPILIGGPGTQVPPNVKVISFTQVIPETQGARLITAATQPFELFELNWNGQQQYANLATATNAFQYSPGNGWHVVESFIPMSDINTSPLAVNTGTATRKTAADWRPQSESVETTNF